MGPRQQLRGGRAIRGAKEEEEEEEEEENKKQKEKEGWHVFDNILVHHGVGLYARKCMQCGRVYSNQREPRSSVWRRRRRQRA